MQKELVEDLELSQYWKLVVLVQVVHQQNVSRNYLLEEQKPHQLLKGKAM